MNETTIKTGDSVLHHPTGEKWLVAYADYERDELAWVGWPPGYAELSDCELVESCTDEKSRELLVEISEMREDRSGRHHRMDHRKSYAIAALKAMEGTT